MPRIYHFTDVANLPAILVAGELRCHAAASPTVEVGDASIKSGRTRIDVTCGPGGKLCDYVPFYGLELLATTHWVAAHEDASAPEVAAELVRSWSQRKGHLFTDEHVSIAWRRLDEGGWLTAERVPAGV